MARGAFLGDTLLARHLMSRDMTLEQLAEAAGMSEQQCRYLARGIGHRGTPQQWTPNSLARISRALQVHPRELAPEIFAARR